MATIIISEYTNANPIPNLVKRLSSERDSAKAVVLAAEAAGVLTNHLSRMGRVERAQWVVWFSWLIRGLKGHIDGWAHRILEQGLLQGTSRPRI